MNLYALVGNNAVTYTDFLGLSSDVETLSSKFGCKYPCKYEKLQLGHAFGSITCIDDVKFTDGTSTFIWHYGPVWPPNVLHRDWYGIAYKGDWFYDNERPADFLGIEVEPFTAAQIGLWKHEALAVEKLILKYDKEETYIYGVNPLDKKQITCQWASIRPVKHVIGNWEFLKREAEAFTW